MPRHVFSPLKLNPSTPDIKLDKILQMLPGDGTEILTKLVDTERKKPGPRKIVDEGLTIYTSQKPDCKGVEYPILGDLGMAEFGQTGYDHMIQPIPYCGPEVILGMIWNQSVDNWNLGILVREDQRPLLRVYKPLNKSKLTS